MRSILYQAAGMVALEKNGRWSLFTCEENDEYSKLIPLKFAQNLSSIKVYEYENLVLTPDAVYTLDGQELMQHNGDAEIITLPTKILIVASGGVYDKRILVWDNKKVLLNESCSDFKYSNKYLALQYRFVWSLFKIDGTPLDEAAFSADDVEIHRDFLIIKSLCKESLYSFKKKNIIKKDRTKVLCSNSCDLALCAKLGENTLEVFNGRSWSMIPNVEEFDLIDGIDSMFYVKQGGKYFIYEENYRVMKSIYPNGVDFVAFDKGLLMIIDKGELFFFNQIY